MHVVMQAFSYIGPLSNPTMHFFLITNQMNQLFKYILL